jgi:hypothetical protein
VTLKTGVRWKNVARVSQDCDENVARVSQDYVLSDLEIFGRLNFQKNVETTSLSE